MLLLVSFKVSFMLLNLNLEMIISDSSISGGGDSAGNSAPVVNPNEIMTSRAITFRDPETGAIYVQTQLLQVCVHLCDLVRIYCTSD